MSTITAGGPVQTNTTYTPYGGAAGTAPASDNRPQDSVQLSDAAQDEMSDPGQWAKDQAHLRQVAGTQDPAARNRQITQDYSNIGNRIHQMTGGDGGANWSTFASFASSRAGQTIRGEDKPGLGSFGETALGILNPGTVPAMQARDAAYAQSQKAVGDGNRNVYQDIAPQLDRFADTFQGDTKPDQKKWDEFAKGFAPDQGDIKDGLHNYYQAMFDKDPHTKQEHILDGNLLLAQREQGRLDPTIKSAMPGTQGNGMLNKAASYFETGHISLPLAKENLSLGSDVPPLNGQQTPAPLTHLGDDPALVQQIQKWGGDAGDAHPLQGTAAGNWSNMADRMKFITGLMRSRQDDPSLYSVVPK